MGIGLVDGIVQWKQSSGLMARPFSPLVNMNLATSRNLIQPSSRLFRPFLQAIRGALTDFEPRLTQATGRQR